MNKWREFAELLGVDFEVPFKAKGVREMLVITDDGVSYVNEYGGYDKDNVLALQLIDGTIEPIKYPKEGDKVYFIDPWEDKGYYIDIWDGGTLDRMIFNRGFLLKTEEEAKAKVKEMGWV